MKEKDLYVVFCRDCHQRLQQAETLLGECRGALTAQDYDLLYQEFDTLHGGARAVGEIELEAFFLGLARYARFLKRCEPARVSEQDRARFAQGIELGRRCEGKLSNCASLRSQPVTELLEQLNRRMADSGHQ